MTEVTMDDVLGVVGLLVTVPRELRRKVKIAAIQHELTMNAFAVAALDFVAANPDVLVLRGSKKE